MHRTIDLKVQYFGTPVVLISSRNEDGSANLAPMSSAWWLNQSCVLGLGNSGQTSANLRRERECVLNLPGSNMVDVVDRLALLTGRPEIAPYRVAQGYRYEPAKFAAAGLTEQPAELVNAPRVLECPVQLECALVDELTLSEAGANATAFHVRVLRCHIDQELIIPGTSHIDPIAWDPLIMKFCEFFGGGHNVYPSTLATGWQMPHNLVHPAHSAVHGRREAERANAK
jgi:flavin reductase (DIM6/NTAB) family NADH-FMN oxidoreductase RutF